jgi:hypothetical protein
VTILYCTVAEYELVIMYVASDVDTYLLSSRIRTRTGVYIFISRKLMLIFSVGCIDPLSRQWRNFILPMYSAFNGRVYDEGVTRAFLQVPES